MTPITRPSPRIVEPTEMLRLLQNKIVRDQFLDVKDDATILVGETNFIAVDFDNILETKFDELRSVEDPKITLQAEFYGGLAQDSGGSREEWISLCKQTAVIAHLQNGLAPNYFSEVF